MRVTDIECAKELADAFDTGFVWCRGVVGDPPRRLCARITRAEYDGEGREQAAERAIAAKHASGNTQDTVEV